MSRASTRDALRGAGAKVPEAGLVPGSAGARVGSTDGALLHFFETEFDEWIAVSYLWRTKSEVRSGSWGGAGVGQDCRCTRPTGAAALLSPAALRARLPSHSAANGRRGAGATVPVGLRRG